MVAIMLGADNGFFYAGQVMHFSSPFTVFLIYHKQYKNTFYQILHEYTHQFTDKLLGDNIRMDDGTHDISERAVILFDYYLIQKLCNEDTGSYLKWVGSLANVDHCDEKLFLSVFKINDDINEILLELVENIIRG